MRAMFQAEYLLFGRVLLLAMSQLRKQSLVFSAVVRLFTFMLFLNVLACEHGENWQVKAPPRDGLKSPRMTR
jgi:hypothetical protein